MSDVSSQPPAQNDPEQSRGVSDEPNVRSAVTFLADPRVKNTTVERKVAFLKGKGLSSEQISSAFQRAGQSVEIEKINSIAPAAPTNASSLQLSQQQQQQTPPPPQQYLTSPRSPFAMSRTIGSHTLYPYTPAPPAHIQRAGASGGGAESKADWRDVVIGVGAACISALGAYHLFQRYSPYEIRRKEDNVLPKSPLRPGRRWRSTEPSMGDNAASALADLSAAAPNAQDVVPPLPDIPASDATSAADPSSAASHNNMSKDLERVQKELSETKETLTNERKRNAELAMNAARARNDQQKISHSNSKLNQTIDELKAKIEELEKDKTAASATHDSQAKEESATHTNGAAENHSAADSSAQPGPSHKVDLTQQHSFFPQSNSYISAPYAQSENNSVVPAVSHSAPSETSNAAAGSSDGVLHRPGEGDFVTDRLASQYTPTQDAAVQDQPKLVSAEATDITPPGIHPSVIMPGAPTAAADVGLAPRMMMPDGAAIPPPAPEGTAPPVNLETNRTDSAPR